MYQTPKILAMAFAIMIAFSCNQNASTTKGLTSNINDMKNTDIAFSKMSQDSGMGRAFIYFADSGVFKLREGRLPLVGKAELDKFYSSILFPQPFVLTWEPVKAEIAMSEDLGYTIGNWEMKTKNAAGTDTTLFGNYITVWKKQSNGSWKYVSDAGSNTPDPHKK